eukprot:g28950.t1
MSHFTIWHYMVEQNIPSALILEDDFDLQENFRERLGSCLEEACGHDWNLMYLGRSPTEGDIRRVSEHLAQPGKLALLLYVGSMFLSDTAMLRNGTKFVTDLPLREGDPWPTDRKNEEEWRAAKGVTDP